MILRRRKRNMSTSEFKNWFTHQFTQAGNCKIWTKATNKDGYGEVWFDGKMTRTHRLMYEFFVGPIPNGVQVLHHCDNPPCGEVTHLWLGTHKDNMVDKSSKGRCPRPVELINADKSGEANGRAILTRAQVREIKDHLEAGGVSGATLARDFGVNWRTISRIKLGQIWVDV